MTTNTHGSAYRRPPLTEFRVSLPPWVPAWFEQDVATLPDNTDDAAWMTLALDLCEQQIQHGTGGPFAALVVDRQVGLLGIGLNCVVLQCCSAAHAEVVAISHAQCFQGTHDLSASPLNCTLYTTSEPCAMCIGAIHWSGISRVVTAARDADVRAIGFDEGHKPQQWAQALAANGTSVLPDIHRERAAMLLQRYADSGAPVYNAAGRR